MASKKKPQTDIAIRANTANPGSTASQLEGTIVHRILYGWLPDAEAASYLGQIATDPNHYQSLLDRHRAMKQNIQDRTVYNAKNVLEKDEKDWFLDSVRQQPVFSSLLATGGAVIGLVNLNSVIAIQKSVKITGLDERIFPATTNKTSLVELCLPTELIHEPRVLIDSSGKAITLSSPNPNFKIMELRTNEVDYSIIPGSPPLKMHAVSIVVGAIQSFIHVTKYSGRYYLKDGYHRAVGLLRAGVHVVPCIISETTSLEQLGLEGGGIMLDVLLGERPPLLLDYLDDNVSGDGLTADMLKVIRVSGEEFNVSG